MSAPHRGNLPSIAESLDAAVALVRMCPLFAYGGRVNVYELLNFM